MNRPSWFPFGRRKEEAEARPEAPDTGRGAITSCGLADVSSLMRPFAQVWALLTGVFRVEKLF